MPPFRLENTDRLVRKLSVDSASVSELEFCDGGLATQAREIDGIEERVACGVSSRDIHDGLLPIGYETVGQHNRCDINGTTIDVTAFSNENQPTGQESNAPVARLNQQYPPISVVRPCLEISRKR